MSKEDTTNAVLFTQKQYDYLNKAYPERTSVGMTNDELRFYSGQRHMVMFIGTRIQKGNT
jgi:hypothetical protein